MGPPFFNATFGPLFVPLLLTMPFGPLLEMEARRSSRRRATPARGGAARSRRDRRGVRAPTRRSGAGTVRRRACDLRHGGALRRYCRAHHGPSRSIRRGAAARGGIAVLGLGLRVRAFRHRRHAPRHRRRDRLGQRAHRRAQAGRDHRHRRTIGSPSRACSTGPGPNYRDVVGHFTVRRTSGDLIGAHGAEPAHLPCPQHGDDRGCADDGAG